VDYSSYHRFLPHFLLSLNHCLGLHILYYYLTEALELKPSQKMVQQHDVLLHPKVDGCVIITLLRSDSEIVWERKTFPVGRILSSTICFPLSLATSLGQEYKCALIHKQLLTVCLKGQGLGRSKVGKLEVWGRGRIHFRMCTE
jgi:hypothetical protein